MKGFKDVVTKDLNTFADTDIFFTTMTVDDGVGEREMRVLFDYDIMSEWKGAPGKGEYINGMYNADVTVYIPLADLGYIPPINSCIKIDGTEFYIRKVTDEAGMLNLVLGGNRQ